MNQSGATAQWTVSGWEGHYRPVWASSFRKVQLNGKTAYFKSKLAAECAAWRTLYAIEQRVMRRDGELVFSAKSAAESLFVKAKGSQRRTVVERVGERA